MSQPPQCAGSLRRSTQLPAHEVCPAPQPPPVVRSTSPPPLLRSTPPPSPPGDPKSDGPESPVLHAPRRISTANAAADNQARTSMVNAAYASARGSAPDHVGQGAPRLLDHATVPRRACHAG